MSSNMSTAEIISFFNKNEDRSLKCLSGVYQEKDRLQQAVSTLFSRHIKSSEIENKSVLLKPNWVREEWKDSDFICLRTNDNLLLCLLEEILKYHPLKVIIADAPVQGCNWDKMITPAFRENVEQLKLQYKIEIVVKDFRRTVADFQNNKYCGNLHPISDYLIFDVSNRSWLEPISTDDNRFRVTCYNPDRMAEVHHKGTHKYCIAKDFFEADVVITVPKLKTHRMAGMTNALKLLVGINGDKDYLPHHRIGSLSEGGDNYKKKSLLRSIGNRLTDEGNRRLGTSFGKLLLKMGAGFWLLSRPDKATIGNAGWYGNDTIWRTVMDINTIALFGDIEGRLHDDPQRKMFIFMDGIVGGQGDGPLHPDPAPLGVLAFSDNPYLMDVVAGHLYHLNHDKIPLLREAKNILSGEEYKIVFDSKEIMMKDVSRFGIDIQMSPGWQDYNR